MERASEMLAAAKGYLERGVSYVETLHVGPLDWNVTQAADQLRTAAANLEMYLQEVERSGQEGAA
jgi:hypothetical protein